MIDRERPPINLRAGLLALFAFTALGLVLEALHGFKLGFYLNVDNETRRLLWRLAHAHGALLGLVNVCYALCVRAWPTLEDRLAARALLTALLLMPLGFVLVALLASTLIALRSLHQHVKRVADALETGGLEAGRAAVSQIVGRDPQSLDEAGVARAAIESLAENFSDGVVAPVFWLAVGGLTGGAAYKAINTADSMIGHKNEKYGAFGYASARLDDLVNLPASRLSALLIAASAALADREAAWRAWETLRRDARKHRSPNAGWPEAAMAGALGLSLAGPRAYGGVMVEDAFMGDGRRDATAQDIRAALALYRRADMILIALVALIAIIALR
jgi:adenosylcobinamide-phosphate synthase